MAFLSIETQNKQGYNRIYQFKGAVKDIYLNDVPLYQKTIDKIYELIDNAEVAFGDRFPPERELAKRWGISRNSVRDAFHILEHRGLVVTLQGSGRYLRGQIEEAEEQSGPRLDTVSRSIEKSSLWDIYCTRQLLEPKVVEDVARNASLEAISGIRAGYEHFAEILKSTGKTTKEMEIHRLYTANCRNFFLVDLVEQALQASEDLMANRFKSEYYVKHTVDVALEGHHQIISAIEKRDTEAASRAMFNHLQHTLDMF